jgi:hypothetical protein
VIFLFKHLCASRGLICIRQQDTQHNTKQEKTRPSNSNTYAHREDLYAFENKTRSTTRNKREHDPATQTRMRIERTYMHSTTRYAAQHKTRENTTQQLKHACASRGLICIRQQDTQHNTKQERTRPSSSNTYARRAVLHTCINNISNNRRQQFTCPIIL